MLGPKKKGLLEMSMVNGFSECVVHSTAFPPSFSQGLSLFGFALEVSWPVNTVSGICWIPGIGWPVVMSSTICAKDEG